MALYVLRIVNDVNLQYGLVDIVFLKFGVMTNKFLKISHGLIFLDNTYTHFNFLISVSSFMMVYEDLNRNCHPIHNIWIVNHVFNFFHYFLVLERQVDSDLITIRSSIYGFYLIWLPVLITLWKMGLTSEYTNLFYYKFTNEWQLFFFHKIQLFISIIRFGAGTSSALKAIYCQLLLRSL